MIRFTFWNFTPRALSHNRSPYRRAAPDHRRRLPFSTSSLSHGALARRSLGSWRRIAGVSVRWRPKDRIRVLAVDAIAAALASQAAPILDRCRRPAAALPLAWHGARPRPRSCSRHQLCCRGRGPLSRRQCLGRRFAAGPLVRLRRLRRLRRSPSGVTRDGCGTALPLAAPATLRLHGQFDGPSRRTERHHALLGSART